nr:centrin-2 [Ipomoea trifida]
MTASLMGSISKAHKKVADKKGKKKVGAHAEEDDEYKPSEGEEGFSSSAEEDENDNGGDGFSKSVSNKSKIKKSTPKKGAPNNQPVSESDFMNDDDALMQAIALSLQDSAGFLDVSKAPNKSAGAHITGENHREKKVDSSTAEGTGKRKRKQSIRNRVQMTEDEFILHFFQFDDRTFAFAYNNSVGFLATDQLRLTHCRGRKREHEYEELGDMIHCFDVDGDGKLSLEEFRKIVIRCNMISVG